MKNLSLRLTGVVLTLVLAFACNKDEGSGPSGDYPSISLKNTIGSLRTSKSDIIVNQNALIQAYFTVNSNLTVDESAEVQLVKRNTNGAEELLGILQDNGDLSNFDDIKGDGVFSGQVAVTASQAGHYVLTVKTKVKSISTGASRSGESNNKVLNVFDDIKDIDFYNLLNIQHEATEVFKSALSTNGYDFAAAYSKMSTWVKAQPEVKETKFDLNSRSMQIRYNSGIKGAVVINQKDQNGTILFRGGFGPDSFPARNTQPTIPANQQTIGTLSNSGIEVEDRGGSDKNVIGNRNVLIYAPFEAAFAPYNEGPKIKSILENDVNCGQFNISYYSNQSANIDVVSTFPQYGIVVLATHGSNGEQFATGEIVDKSSPKYTDAYEALIQANKLVIWTQMTIGKNGNQPIVEDVYAIDYSYINDLGDNFPNSLILNNSCESTMTEQLSKAFLGKGAQTYLGYSKVVNSDFCVAVAESVFNTIAKEGKTAGEIDKINDKDPADPFAQFQIKGNQSLRFSGEFINGSFEEGLTGWSKDGDGRCISQLGYIGAVDGTKMGVISTGLGFTTTSGGLSQSFTMPTDAKTLELSWNFISEEFLEYIGSQFQDRLVVSVIDENKTEKVLYAKTIDEMAADFSASKDVAGNLKGVSPAIVFDQGDVYMTGFQKSSFDISEFKGKCVTLILKCTDVGDSIYDTAILLDGIDIK